MKIPWALRVDLILAILKGEVISLSYWDNTYRFDIPSKSADRWRRRNATIKAKGGN